MSIDEVRAWFVARGHGISADERLLYERVAGLLAPGEALELESAMTCNNLPGNLVLTDQRIIHIGRHMLGMKVTEVARSDVTKAKRGGLLIPGIVVEHRDGKVKFAGGLKPQAAALLAALGG
ncbi:MAG: hypothetical protein KBF47_17510 [Gemmatimonadales bacterium]|nr:hypothetical protein [Gemmatimonadales bacterium]